jgi:O-antigen/teichoic acid export membrane protein
MIATLTDPALTELFGRFIPEISSTGELQHIQRFSSRLLALKIAAVVITSLVLIPTLYFVYRHRFPISYFVLIIAILFITSVGNVCYALLFGLNKMGKYSFRDPLRRVLSLSFILPLFYYYGIFGALLSFFLVETFLTILNFHWTKQYFRLRYFDINLPYLIPYLKFGLIFYVSTGLCIIWMRLGNILVEYITHSLKEVTLFDMPNQIFLIVFVFSYSIVTSITPIFIEFHLNGRHDKLTNWSILLTKYNGILCIVGVGIFYLLGRDITTVVIGSKYKDIFTNSIIQLLGVFPMIIVQLGYVFSIVHKTPYKYLKSMICALVSFIFFSILLIPKYASLGCSVSMFISCIVMAAFLCLYFKNEMNPCLVALFKIAIPSFVLIPFVVIYSSSSMNIFLAVCFVAVYCLLLLATGTVKVREINELIYAVVAPRKSLT